MANFAINASGAMLLPSLVKVSESISGSVVPLAMFRKKLWVRLTAESKSDTVISINTNRFSGNKL